MNYPSIRIEGAILSPDILDRLEDLPGQRPADFGLDSGVKVKDEIVRAWADAQDYWRIFQRKLDALKPDSPATTETRQQWIVPLLGLLGHPLEYQQKGAELNGKIYAISHRIVNRARAPLHIVGCRDPAGLDRKPANATLRMSAHAMVQEYLNLHDELYGIVTNGRVLRLLRDSSRLVKQSYLEFDLDRIFTDGIFADFAIFYRLLHASRLPATNDTAPESWIERYHQDSLDSGARIRDGLSKAVEEAIRAFGNGFLSHADNEHLREQIAAGKLNPLNFYRSLLGLIYRLLFLMVIEERDLIYPLGASRMNCDIYYRYYSLHRLRSLSERRYLADRRRHDLWLALLSTFRLFEADGPGEKIGIKPLAGDLFGPRDFGILSECSLGNDVLLGCLRSLGLYEHPDNRQLIRVNYAALNVEEFGSVYEGLLEFEPVFTTSGSTPEFSFKQGDARSATGSHYTPDDLVQPLIKHSLDYLIADRLKLPNPESALLDLRVADIACGSGHILLAAARRIATELAIVRTGEEQPSPTAYRAALRDVICTCIYGVDLNPLAVELCKVALWLEAHNPGEPLNFLDHHIKCGNAIVGFARREDVERGIPDEAFKTLVGDDKDVAAEFRKRNKTERKAKEQVRMQFTNKHQSQLAESLEQWKTITSMPERTPEQIEEKKMAFMKFEYTGTSSELNLIASLPIAQFYIPKTEANRMVLVTDSVFRDYWSGTTAPGDIVAERACSLSIEKRIFHWFLEFPEIMSQGGFDCILGNPPYLGGQALSGTYGHPFCEYMKWEFAPTGLSELVVFFVRRIFRLLRPKGFTAFITTNSIKDGDIRKDGLDQIVAQGGEINMAVRAIKWPGRANLSVSLVALHKGSWRGQHSLDGQNVETISSHFENSDDACEAKPLDANASRIFQGSIYLGDGFLLSHSQADQLLAADRRYREVIFSVTNGQEINSEPDQKPGRSIINFHDWSLKKASTYEGPFEVVERLVKPARINDNRALYRDTWWLYAERRPGLVAAIRGLQRCFVIAQTSKHFAFSAISTDIVVLQTAYVFASSAWSDFAVVQSNLHYAWVCRHSGTLETCQRYLPTQCFVNYPFPQKSDMEAPLCSIGERYHERRRQLMLSLWLGLTDIYNLFHARDLDVRLQTLYDKRAKKLEWRESVPEEHRVKAGSLTIVEAQSGIQKLRRLHTELDHAVLNAYGWATGSDALNLSHDFHEIETLPENDRVRYTISPTARKELLKRLLSENHARAAQEAATTPSKPGKKKPKPSLDDSPGPLFSQTSEDTDSSTALPMEGMNG